MYISVTNSRFCRFSRFSRIWKL